MNFDEFCAALDSRLAQGSWPEDRLETAVNALCQAFGVKSHEVAVFFFDAATEMFSFLWPLSLRNSGAVPLSAVNALVSRTALERKGHLNNAFASTPHASLFERFRQDDGGPSHPIQKIMSVPLEKDGIVQWVIQVSRKGGDVASAGRDFTPNELKALELSARVIARHL